MSFENTGRDWCAAMVLVALAPAAWGGAAVSVPQPGALLPLEHAVALAQQHDPWLVGNRLAQQSVEAASVAAGALPDPKVAVGFMNLPTDTFDFNQEPMTQFSVGLSQSFPRGSSLKLRRQQLALQAEQYPLQRQERLARIEVMVSELWLELYKTRGSIALIDQNRVHFEQLVDVAMSSYAAAVRRMRQQDVIRAELELTRLADRLTVLEERGQTLAQDLGKWLGESGSAGFGAAGAGIPGLGRALPDTALRDPRWVESGAPPDRQLLGQYLLGHPAIAMLDKKIEATGTGIDLARQKYKPEWGVAASYGYRDDDPTGARRADFFSVGVTLDVPLFTANRQDRELQAAVADAESVKSEKWLALRDMVAAFESARAQYRTLGERQRLYRQRLLPQMHQQAEAALSAYTSAEGDFAEVARARIAELSALIDALGIDVERQKVIARLNYFFVHRDPGAATVADGPRTEP